MYPTNPLHQIHHNSSRFAPPDHIHHRRIATQYRGRTSPSPSPFVGGLSTGSGSADSERDSEGPVSGAAAAAAELATEISATALLPIVGTSVPVVCILMGIGAAATADVSAHKQSVRDATNRGDVKYIFGRLWDEKVD